MRANGFVLAAMLVTLAGCQKKAEETAAGAQAAVHTINDSMAQIMEPGAETIWDTMSKAYNDKGDALDPSKLSEDDWSKMADAAAKLRDRAQEIADHVKSIKVADAGEPIMGSQAVGQIGPAGADWDAVDAKTIQSRIDAKPDLFRQKAMILVDSADKMHRASTTKDVKLLYNVASELDEVCDGCHEPFWGTDEPPPYPKGK